MRVLLVVCWLLAGSSALAGTIYTYTDPVTKREVFVNHLEQVPAALRDSARPVRTGEAEVEVVAEISTRAGSSGSLQLKDVPVTLADLRKTMETAVAGGSPIKVAGQTLVTVMDLKLKSTGRPGLYPSEVIAFSKLFGLVLVLLAAAWVASFITWVIFLFHAGRSRRYVWLVAMLLVYPVAYLYALLCVEKGRWKLRYLGFLSLVSPALVGLFAFWRFFAWLRAVFEARGGLG